MAIPSQDLRRCTKCGRKKNTSEFYHRSDAKKSLAQECKSCTKKRTQTRYWDPNRHEAIREQNNAYGRTRRVEIKDAVFKAYGGYKCACCGVTEKSFLTLDHVNNDGAEFRRMLVGTQARGGGYVTYRWLAARKFPAGLQVLCANCQHGKRMNGGTCPHQVRRNDHPKAGVGSSDPKRIAPLIN